MIFRAEYAIYEHPFKTKQTLTCPLISLTKKSSTPMIINRFPTRMKHAWKNSKPFPHPPG